MLVEEAHAAGAVDAAVQHDTSVGVEVEVIDTLLVLAVARGVGTVGHGDVLEVAVGGLLANGAVVGVVDEDELDVALAGVAHEAGVGQHGHAGQGDGRARNNHVLGSVNLHQAHAAVTGDGQHGVVAELWDADVLALHHLKQVLLVGDDLDGALVDEHDGARFVLGVLSGGDDLGHVVDGLGALIAREDRVGGCAAVVGLGAALVGEEGLLDESGGGG